MNWIKARLNRDNFWNLVFVSGIVLSVFLADKVLDFNGFIGLALLISSFTVVPLLLVQWNKVKYVKDKGFFNSRNKSLNTNLPKHFGIIFACSIIATGLLVSKDFNSLSICSIVLRWLFLVISYFIYKNCPVSILFNKFAWINSKEVLGLEAGNYDGRRNTHCYKVNQVKNIASKNIYTDPTYSGLSCNIHNINRKL